jgi:protein-disulfide isomerase
MKQTGKPMQKYLIPAILGLLGGLGGAALWDVGEFGKSTDEAAIRQYLLTHPEVLPEAIDELQRREMLARIEPARPRLEAAYPGAVLGNPQGSITMVEFSDYACGFCRASIGDVQALLQANPEVRLVIREYPILSQGSVEAARMALAAAEQGKFEAFHFAMFEQGRQDAEAIEAAALTAGLDLAEARTDIASGKYDVELSANVSLARELGFDGTPSWVIGNDGFAGAVGLERLTAAVEQAREVAAAS